MRIDYKINIIKSNTAEILPKSELFFLLSENREVRVKIGFDPTASNLHLGHVVLLKKLKEFQQLNYKICLIIGDFTAMIGDPSGRSNVRESLTEKQVYQNYSTYCDQIFNILDPNLTEICYNSLWFNFFKLGKFIYILSKFTVFRMLERNDFKNRFNKNKVINIHEFIYPILQAYDSLFIDADIEIGGIDQKFNLLLGRELQKKSKKNGQIIVMLPILRGLDGDKKMSKTFENHININDDFYNMFCKIMSIPDKLMKEYFLLIGILLDCEYKFLESKKKPFNMKLNLAFKIVSLFHGSYLAFKAQKKFLFFFSNRQIPTDLKTLDLLVTNFKSFLSDVLMKVEFISSISEFKRLLRQKAIKVNAVVVTKRDFFLLSDMIYILQVGKRKIVKIFLKKK